jgi:hypothetical protein
MACFCQIEIQNSVLAASGSTMSNSTLGIEFTFGETFTQSYTNTQLITQGFQQPYRKKIVIQPTKPTDNLGVNNWDFKDINLYPNPFSSSIQIENISSETLQVDIFDLTGRLVFSQAIINLIQTINLEHLSSGPYQIIFSINKEFLFEETLIKTPN